MRKSKSWIKSLLIVVLAMIMVVSLVACNKPDPEPQPDPDPDTELTAAGEYFDTLWKVAAPIGQQEIAATDDIALAFGAEISLDTKRGGMESMHKVDIGIDVQAVIGRTKSTTNNTSIKLKLYDPTDTNNDEIFTLYAFANELDNLYIDFGGKNIKIPHGMASYIWQVLRESPKTGMDNTWKSIIDNIDNVNFDTHTIADLLAAKFIGATDKKSINEVVNIFVGDFNENWTLSKLISGVLDTLNVNVVEMLSNLGAIGNGIKTLLGLQSWDELLTDGKFDIYPLLLGDIGSMLVKSTDKIEDNNGVTTHTASVANIANMAIGMIPNIGSDLSEMIYQLDGNGNVVEGGIDLIFSESNNKIQDFTIKVILGGLTSKVPNQNGIGTTKLIPELSIKINKLRINKADTSNQIALKANKTYSDKIAINERFEIAVDGTENGIVVKPIDGLMGEDAPLKGKIVLDVKGMVDLVNPAATNESAVNVSVKRYWEGNEDGTDVITGSYYQGKVAVKFAEAMEINGEMVQGYYYDLDTETAKFDLVAFVKEQIAEFIYTNFNGVDKPVEGNTPGEGGDQEGGTGTTQAGATDMLTKVLDTINKAFETAIKLVNTDNNKLTVSTPNILQTIIDFKKAINPANKGETEWTEENRQIAIVKTMTNVEEVYDTVENCLNKATAAYENFMSVWSNKESTAEDIQTATDTLIGEVKKVAVGLVYVIGSQVRFDGVTYDGLVATDYAKYKASAEAADFTEEQMQYINNVLAVLAAGITVSGDLQNGINASVVAKIADVTITISNTVAVIDVTNGMFIDVYGQNEADIKKDPTTINPGDPIWKSLNKPAPEEPGTGNNPGTPDQGQENA